MRRNMRGYNSVPFTRETRFMFDRICHPMFDEGTHATSLDLRRLRQFWIFTRNDDLRNLANLAQAARSIEDFVAGIRERQASILIDRHSRESGAAEESNRTSTKTIWAMEFIVPGVFFPLAFDLDVNDAQMGLFLLALDSFAKSERIGANSRNGMGQFALNEVLVTDRDGTLLSSGIFNNSRMQRDVPGIQVFLNAWSHATSQITGADLDRLFDPRVDEAKARKTSKKAKSE
jgi:CRISPR type IV-associated protein Csf2